MKIIKKIILIWKLLDAQRIRQACLSLFSQGIMSKENDIHFNLWCKYDDRVKFLENELMKQQANG